MLPIKLRLKILNKLAQSALGAPASPASPTAPTKPASTTGTKSPSPPASSMMNTPVGWTNWAQPLDKIIAKVDKVIIAGTKNEYNFNDLFQNKFPSGVDTKFPPPDPTGDIIRFGRQIYQYVMNSGVPFREGLQRADMRNRIEALLKSDYLQKFQQVNIRGPLAGVGADLSTIRSDILSLYNSIPVV